MMLFKLATRNFLRNRRRSVMTTLAVAVGAMTMLLFGAFQAFVFRGLETDAVRRTGHLTIFKRGYFLFGAGNPSAYSIERYEDVISMIRQDPELKPFLRLVTPTLSLAGIAGNFDGEISASKTFFGVGKIPSDRDRMRQWDEHGVSRNDSPDTLLSDTDETRGYVGLGLARVLGLCEALKIADCPPARRQNAAGPVAAPGVLDQLPAIDPVDAAPGSATPHLELLAATSGGAPNVVRVQLSGVEPQAAKELDDNFVGVHLKLAQQLVFGRGEHKVTGIIVQLHRTEDLARVRDHLAQLFAARKLDLEIRDFGELNPFYVQVRRFFGSIFLFIALIMGVITLFTIVNTMTMAVMERTSEIGTTRALGARRGSIRLQFMTEGLLLGAVGATLGLAAAVVETAAINAAHLNWTPPGNAAATPFGLALWGHPWLLVGGWLVIVAVATFAALIPANRAARLQVVDALRHA